MSTKTIDLNLDAGESLLALEDGSEEKLYELVTSVNIACGGHTGDERTMRKAVRLAKKWGLNVGAHPSFPDRANFGRSTFTLASETDGSLLFRSLMDQVNSLAEICDSEGIALTHVKAHGALYNLSANDQEFAQILIELLQNINSSVKVMTLAESQSVEWFKEAGLQVLSEGFVDRRYEPNRTLRARTHDDAMITDVAEASSQALKIVKEAKVTTIAKTDVELHVNTLCIHGDSATSYEVAKSVREHLTSSGIRIQKF